MINKGNSDRHNSIYLSKSKNIVCKLLKKVNFSRENVQMVQSLNIKI